MSKETLEWLNTMCLIGQTDNRNKAWHWRASAQGEEPNSYPGAIPLADVERRLFNWSAEPRRVAVEVPADLDTMTHLDEFGMPVRWNVQADKQAVTRDDTHLTMGIFSEGYAIHQFREWLLGTVSNILGDTLCISSAGLLRQGAVAWVEVSVPESVTTPEGVVFRPNLLATTSHDGTSATTYKRTITDTVCDNTRSAALGEVSPEHKIRHSKYSKVKILDARQALAMVHDLAEDFTAEIATLCAADVSPGQFAKFVDLAVPLTKDGEAVIGRAKTMAENKRDQLLRLYRHDPRVAPWAGTVHGVIQMVNTWEHHESIVRGATRAERNMLRTISDDFTNVDRGTYKTLQTAMA